MFILLFSFFLSTSFSSAQTSDPFQDTLVGNLLESAKDDAVEIKVCGPIERYGVPGLRRRDRCDNYLYYRSGATQELVFLFGGLGAGPEDRIAQNLASFLHQNGFSVLIVPSAFYATTIRLWSSSGIAGFPPQDGTDGLHLAKVIFSEAKKAYDIQPSKVHFVGYSYGALQAFFADRTNRYHPEMSVDRVVMINPPADLTYAVFELDKIHRDSKIKDSQLAQLFVNFVFSPFKKIVEILTDEEFDSQIQESDFDSEEAQALIAESFYRNLAEAVVATQDVNDLQVLSGNRMTSMGRYDREDEAKLFTFELYMNRIALPYWTSAIKWDAEQIIHANNLKSYAPELAADDRFRILNTANDFLTDPNDVPTIQAVMPNRYYLQNRGGHLGQVKIREFRLQLLEYLK